MPKPGTRVLSGIPGAFAVEPYSPAAFAHAAGWTLAALALRLAIGYVDPSIPPFATFFAATLIAAIIAGVAAGLTAAALGFALCWILFRPSMAAAFTPAAILLYVITSIAIVWVSEQYRALLRRIQEKDQASERQLALIAAENEVLSQIARDAPLPSTLERLTRSVEDYSEGRMLASVLLMDADGETLRHGAAPSLPAEYNRAIDGVRIGPSVGSCGTAAHRKEPVYVADIETDPLWADYRELARRHGLRACWSMPIFSRSGAVTGTFALYHREPRSPSAQEKEIVALMTRIAAVAIEHERDRAQRQLLVDELTHRVKNALTVVLSIASSTIRSHTDEARYKAFEDRLIALSKTQNLLTQANWSSVDVKDLINDIAVTPFAGGDGRFRLSGERAYLPARLTLPFALSLHELCTNAAKYGALATEGGRVNIDWRVEHGGTRPRQFVFRWSEEGGPPVAPPERQGFGSRMIRSAFSGEGAGDATVDYRAEGLVCEIVVPLDQSPPLAPAANEAAARAH